MGVHVLGLANKIVRFDIQSVPDVASTHGQCALDSRSKVYDVMSGHMDCVVDSHLAHMEIQKKRLTPVSENENGM